MSTTMMEIVIESHSNGAMRLTTYNQAELRRDALHAVKGKGKLTNYWVRVNEGAAIGANVVLVAKYQRDDGFLGTVNVAI
jgi:hypothetical protein